MRILTIGGTGFLSAPVVEKLLDFGHEVAIFTNGDPPNPFGDRIRSIVGDRDNPDDLKSALGDVRPDVVIDVIPFTPQQTQAMISLCTGKVRQFIHCSTASVYEYPLSCIPANEGASRKPASLYGQNKLECEKLLTQAHRESGFPVTIFRPNSIYGPGHLLESMWWRDPYLIDRIRKGKAVFTLGDGQTLWHLNYNYDVADAVARMIDNEKVIGHIYNVMGPEILTHDDYFRALGKVLGCEVKIVHVPTEAIIEALGPDGEAKTINQFYRWNNAFDTSKAGNDLPGWQRTDIISGLRTAVEWLDKNDMHENSDETDRDDRIIAAANKGKAAMLSLLQKD